MLNPFHLKHCGRPFSPYKMQGLWWATLRYSRSIQHKDPIKCLPFSGISWINPEPGQSVVLGDFMCFPHGLRDICMIRLGFLIMNEYECQIVDILTRSVYNSGRCIIRRQPIWQEGMLTLNLNMMRPTCIFCCLASLTYYI